VNSNSRTDMVKLGAAAAGGYVLGRTKKGKLGLSLALWAAGGTKYSTKNLVRTGIIKLARTPQVQAMVGELRESVVHGGQQAMTTALEARASAMTDALQRRTDSLAARVQPGGQDQGEPSSEKRTDEGEHEARAPEESTDKQAGEGARQSGPPNARAPQQRSRQQAASTEGVRG
jgi:hypothetical protein